MEKCDTKKDEQERIRVGYQRKKMRKSYDFDKSSSNEKAYVRSQRRNQDPEVDDKLLKLGGGDNSPEKN